MKIDLPNNNMVQAALSASYGMLGEESKAEEALHHPLEIRPDYPDDTRAPYRIRGMRPELIDGRNFAATSDQDAA